MIIEIIDDARSARRLFVQHQRVVSSRRRGFTMNRLSFSIRRALGYRVPIAEIPFVPGRKMRAGE